MAKKRKADQTSKAEKKRQKKKDNEDDDEEPDADHTALGEDDDDEDDQNDGMFGLDVGDLLKIDETDAPKGKTTKKPASRKGGATKKPASKKREEAPNVGTQTCVCGCVCVHWCQYTQDLVSHVTIPPGFAVLPCDRTACRDCGEHG